MGMSEAEFKKAAVDILRRDTDAWVRVGPLGHVVVMRAGAAAEVHITVTPRQVVMPGPPNGSYVHKAWTVDADGLGYAYRVMGPLIALEVLRQAASRDAERIRAQYALHG
jgi:hypothetical protein